MGLFDKPTKQFATKLCEALHERAAARDRAAANGGVDAPLHRFVSVALLDMELIIRSVAELGEPEA